MTEYTYYYNREGKIFTLDEILSELGYFRYCPPHNPTISSVIKCEEQSYYDIIANSYRGERYVYVLSLENGKYYVGYTSNLKNRLVAHFNGTGPKYTRVYRVISVVNVYRGYKEESSKECVSMINKYGKDNVTGYIGLTSIGKELIL